MFYPLFFSLDSYFDIHRLPQIFFFEITPGLFCFRSDDLQGDTLCLIFSSILIAL
jgi:hypothetical protein